MMDQSQYLLTLVKRAVQAYIANPKTKAVMVTGSVAEGLCDEYSDCDVMLYYEELPSAEELQLARQQNPGAELVEILGDRQEGAFGETFVIEGVECQFAHATIAQWEKEMASVLEEFNVQAPIMRGMTGTLNGIPLYGEAVIQAWKARIASYPDELAYRMVQHYLKFFPIWGMQEKLARRDTTLWYHQILVESAQNLLGVLAGLNRLYYSTFQFKRMSRFIQQMTLAPENLADRLEGLFRSDAAVAICQLESLVQETVELLEWHMPDVDTSLVRGKLGWRQSPWTLKRVNPMT